MSLEVVSNPHAIRILRNLEEIETLIGNIDFIALRHPERILIEKNVMGKDIGGVCRETMLGPIYGDLIRSPAYQELIERLQKASKRVVRTYNTY